MVHVAATCLLFMLNGLERFCHFSPRGFYSITTTEFMFGIWWPVLLCSFMVYFISWCLLICFFCSFLFIHVHLFSCLFIFSHFVSVLFIFFLFLPFSVFSWKNITNLNHLHVDPRLSSAAKPVISAKSIPTAPMDPISCPSDFFGRRIRRITSEDIRSVPKCAEVCRSAYICRKYVPSVPSESFSKKWVSQERTCFTLGDSALDVNLEPLHLFTIKIYQAVSWGSPGIALSVLYLFHSISARGSSLLKVPLMFSVVSVRHCCPAQFPILSLKGVESTMVPWLASCCSKNPGDHGRYGRMLQPSALCQTSTCGPVAPSPSVREAFASHPPVLQAPCREHPWWPSQAVKLCQAVGNLEPNDSFGCYVAHSGCHLQLWLRICQSQNFTFWKKSYATIDVDFLKLSLWTCSIRHPNEESPMFNAAVRIWQVTSWSSVSRFQSQSLGLSETNRTHTVNASACLVVRGIPGIPHTNTRTFQNDIT